MARISIDDSLIADERMKFVMRELGEDVAIGAWYRIAKCAQRYWCNDNSPIPRSVWEISGFPEQFIKSGLVAELPEGFYLSGSREHFAWLHARRKNGKLGGRPKNQHVAKPKYNLKEPKHNLNEPNRNPTAITTTIATTITKNKTNTSPTGPVREAFCAAFRQRYGIDPVWAAKESSLAKKLLQAVGESEAVRLASCYPAFNDPWHIKQKHPFALLVAQLDKVRVEIANPNRMLDHAVAHKELERRAQDVSKEFSRQQLEDRAKRTRIAVDALMEADPTLDEASAEMLYNQNLEVLR